MLISRFWTTSKICDRMMCWFQMITIYVWHLTTRKYFCLINEVIFFIHIIFETFSSLYVSSILMRTAAWRSQALQIRAYWVLLRIYDVWQKHCDWEVFLYGRCLRSLYNTKLSQICSDLYTADESTPAFCEAPGGLQEPGAVSKSLPLWRATSLGMTNNVH